MDQFDARMLTAMQANNRLTSLQLAEVVGLSPAACQKRSQKLRRSGIIEADVSVLNPAAVGRGLILIVQVHVEREYREHLDRFKNRMKDAPEVMQCYYVTGASDFILIVSARDMPEYEEFTRRHFMGSDNVAHFYTSVVMDRVKFTLSVPVETNRRPEE